MKHGIPIGGVNELSIAEKNRMFNIACRRPICSSTLRYQCKFLNSDYITRKRFIYHFTMSLSSQNIGKMKTFAILFR